MVVSWQRICINFTEFVAKPYSKRRPSLDSVQNWINHYCDILCHTSSEYCKKIVTFPIKQISHDSKNDI